MRRGGEARRLRPPRVARFLAVLLRVLPCCVAGFLAVWSGADAVLQGGRALPRCGEGASCHRMKPRPPLRARSPRHVKLRPPLHAHNSTIQANYGTQGRLRLHLLEPQGTQGRCQFHTFPRVPSYGGMPADFLRSRRYAARSPIAMAQIAARGGASSVGSADNRERACTSRGA